MNKRTIIHGFLLIIFLLVPVLACGKENKENITYVTIVVHDYYIHYDYMYAYQYLYKYNAYSMYDSRHDFITSTYGTFISLESSLYPISATQTSGQITSTRDKREEMSAPEGTYTSLESLRTLAEVVQNDSEATNSYHASQIALWKSRLDKDMRAYWMAWQESERLDKHYAWQAMPFTTPVAPSSRAQRHNVILTGDNDVPEMNGIQKGSAQGGFDCIYMTKGIHGSVGMDRAIAQRMKSFDEASYCEGVF
jgi:hypothetical protein